MERVLRDRLEKRPDETGRNPHAADHFGVRRLILGGPRHQLAEVDDEVVLAGLDEREVRVDARLEFRRKLNIDLLGRRVYLSLPPGTRAKAFVAWVCTTRRLHRQGIASRSSLTRVR